MNTIGCLNTHVLKNHIIVMIDIYKFRKPYVETTLVDKYLLSQYGIKKGIQILGERVVRAFQKDLEQLHNRKVIQPRLSTDLAVEHKIKALSYLILTKDKIYVLIKGRGCADGRPQRIWMKN